MNHGVAKRGGLVQTRALAEQRREGRVDWSYVWLVVFGL